MHDQPVHRAAEPAARMVGVGRSLLQRGVGSDHQGWQIRPLAADFAEKFVARHAAAPRVGDDHEKIFAAEQTQRLLGGFGGAHGVTFIAEHGLQRATHVFFVVHDQHGWQRQAHGLNGFGDAFSGKTTVNFAPFPSSDSTRTMPL